LDMKRGLAICQNTSISMLQIIKYNHAKK